MIAPVPLPALVATSRLQAAKAAIVAGLARLLPGVTVTSHPGKLDINDVLAAKIVQAPGIALGWSRVRAARDLGGTVTEPVDWVAYVVVNDYRDTSEGAGAERLVGREVVGHAIGSQLLRILADPDASSWGLTGLDVVSTEPPPQFAPVLTMKTAENGIAIYAVSWSQALVLEGEPFFDGPQPVATADPDGDGVDFDFDTPPDELPIEMGALVRSGP